jgi:hypothetical protein
MNNSKFCIYIPDEPTGKRVKEIAEKNGMTKNIYHDDPVDCFYPNFYSFWNGEAWGWNKNRCDIFGDYPTITLSEFESLFSTKEIIGYKCPMDLFGGLVRAGTVYNFEEHTKDLYYPTTWRGSKGLPKEIVETWEPVFKKEEEKVVICGGEEIRIKEDCIIIGALEVQNINDLTIHGLITFFRHKTTLSELKNLVDQFNPGKA